MTRSNATSVCAGAGFPAALIAALLLSACSAATPAPVQQPPEVSVVTVKPQTVEDQLEFTGQVDASRTVQVRAQDTGVIIARPFREGAMVRPGDVLYRIDPTTYAASYRSALAQIAQNEATLANAETVARNQRSLLADNATAKQSADSAEAALKSARASVENARASLATARYNLQQAVVRAEIAGRVGSAQIDVGTRVTGPSDVLTTIDVVDPVYVSFRPSAEQLLRWQRDSTLRGAFEPGGSARLQPILADGTPYATAAHIDFVNPVVDSATGTQQFRATFRNPDRLILPGQFVRVRLLGLSRPDAILVPQRAVIEQMGRQMVYVVDSTNKVASRQVTATGWSGTNWLIEKGLNAGDRVVVDGVQKIGPGAVVRPVALADENATTATDSAQATHIDTKTR